MTCHLPFSVLCPLNHQLPVSTCSCPGTAVLKGKVIQGSFMSYRVQSKPCMTYSHSSTSHVHIRTFSPQVLKLYLKVLVQPSVTCPLELPARVPSPVSYPMGLLCISANTTALMIPWLTKSGVFMHTYLAVPSIAH